MAQFSAFLSVLVVFTLCKPIVCLYDHLPYDRRDRAPYIDSREYSTQEPIGQTALIIGNRFTYTDNNANYRHEEQQVEAPQVVDPAAHNRAIPTTHHNHRDEINILAVLEKNLRIFGNYIGPDTHVFDNFNQSDHNQGDKTTTHMAVDQETRSIFDIDIDPDTHVFDNFNQSDHNQGDKTTTHMAVDQETRSIFDIDIDPDTHVFDNFNQSDHNQGDKTTTHTAVDQETRNIFDIDIDPDTHVFDNVNRSDSDPMIGDQPVSSFGKYFHNPSSGGLSLIRGKVETSTQDHIRKKETSSDSIADTKDCIEDDVKSGKPFCTRLRNYPEKSYLEKLIKTKFNHLESFFGEDSVMLENLTDRANSEAPVILCKSRTRVIYPEAGLNKGYEWLYIINTDKYKQGVLVEECINEGSVSDFIYPTKNYKATCKQNYIYRSLAAFANGTIVKDQFKMPSCCKCVLTVT